jgi:pimeloyl-ACP methyl ester carboxylesterase
MTVSAGRIAVETSTSAAPRLAYERHGRGEPLVLLHGQGFSRRIWDSVIPGLAAHRDVIAVDLPGHGDSPRQPDGRGNAPRDLAVAVAELLDELGLRRAHVAGSSQGGWVALELGRLQRALTVTCLAPAGLWRRDAPRYIRVSMRQARLQARIVRRLAPNAPRTRVARAMSMISASGRPMQLPYEPVHRTMHDMASAPGFRETLRALERSRFEDGDDITVPVTIAFGTRDRVLLPRVARRRDQLPDHARWIRLPGCGHVAMLDDPSLVRDVLLHSTNPDTAVRLGVPVREVGSPDPR